MSPSFDLTTIFEKTIVEHMEVINSLSPQLPVLTRIAMKLVSTIEAGNKVLWCGNGGSAADSQHLAAEFVGRFCRERSGLPSIALTTDSSVLTAVSNDYGYEQVFCRQVEALCNRGDAVVGISTSGNSKNVVLALEKANQLGAFTAAFTGEGGGALGEVAQETLSIASKNAARIQEAHIVAGHILCDWVELHACGLRAAKESE